MLCQLFFDNIRLVWDKTEIENGMEYQLATDRCLCAVLYRSKHCTQRIQYNNFRNEIPGRVIGELFCPMLSDVDVLIADIECIYRKTREKNASVCLVLLGD